MRLAPLGLASVLPLFVAAQLVLPQTRPNAHAEDLDQIPIELDFGWHEPGMSGHRPNGPPLLSDILGIDRSLSIFAGLGRSIESIATRLADDTLNSTLLVPRNSALQVLPRKPWEDDGGDDPRIIQGNDGLWSKEAEDQAAKNVETFVASHLVTLYPIQEGKQLPTLTGSFVSYSTKHGKTFIHPGNIEVVGQREAANGAIWVLDGVLEQ